MTLPVYITGTVSVSNLGTVVTGTGCMWSGINAREGDFFTRPDGVAIITEVTDVTHLKITPWPGATIAGGAYAIQQNYVGRVVGVAAAEDVGVMLEKLHVDGLPFIVGVDETVPDPSYGDEGQMAFKPDTGAWWVKSGGVWVPSVGLSALGYGGTSATSILIATGPATFTTQGGLAYNGARVRAASAANLNNWMEGVAAYTGTSLAMTVDKIHGSGTHADWLLSIGGQPGLDGTGTGDMLAANNLSELTATAATARKNIFAAPFDALAYNGMQINGSMDASQEVGASTVSLGSSLTKYGPDGWLGSAHLTTGQVNIYQLPLTTEVPGFQNAFQMVPSVAQATLSGTDYFRFQTYIEGYRFARAAWGTSVAVPVTVGFWVRASASGTYRALMYNFGGTSVSAWMPFTITGGPFQWVTITFAAMTTGTWKKDNTIGAVLLFEMASSSTPNLMASTSNYASINGVVVLPGIEAPSAARSPLIMRPFDQELVTCKRYWERCSGAYRSTMTSNGVFVSDVSYKVTKRSGPALLNFVPGPTKSNSNFGSFLVGDDFVSAVQFTGTANAESYNLGFLFDADARL
jgi:hypothetical protein